MIIRKTLILAFLSFVVALSFLSADSLGGKAISMPGQDGKRPAIDYAYFPSRLHAFVFRNWTCVPASRLAKTVGASEEQICSIAAQLGLPKQGRIESAWKDKGYITVLRRNWHLLDYPQLLTLLGMSAQELEFKLIADDFLYIKLGSIKPKCGPLVYAEPDSATLAKCAEFRKLMKSEGAERLFESVERFRFNEEISLMPMGTAPAPRKGSIVMAYPYFSEYGDCLLDDDISSYPDEILKRYQQVGVNAVWLHVVLRTLVSNDGLYDDSPDAPRRIRNLNKLISRAEKYGIKVFLYFNEPRSMPPEFFESSELRSSLKGTPDGGLVALCTSQKPVIDWLENATERLFKAAPKLGGIFTITASECLTNCLSHRLAKNICKVCSARGRPVVVSEVNNAIFRGMRSASKDAELIVWDWGWRPEAVEGTVELLEKDCILMCVSEWDLPFKRGTVESKVNEYCISCSDSAPGPRAKNLWNLAKKRGMRTMAKVQVNTSWEFSPVPYIPYVDIVVNHAKNLKDMGVDNVLLNWSLGGYPSVNIEAFNSFDKSLSVKDNLKNIAVRRYGENASASVLKAWTEFSDAWRQFPFDIALAYFGAQHMGASNPIYVKPSGYHATMVGIPYDNLASWRSKYPNDVLIGQLEKVVAGLDKGISSLLEAESSAGLTEDAKREISSQIRYARCASISLKSFANQAKFIILRNRISASTTKEAFDADKEEILSILNEEKLLAREMYKLCLEDEFIGYEASNHYFYIPADLLEKIASVEYAREYFSSKNFEASKR